MKISYDRSIAPPAPYLTGRISNLTGGMESPPIPAKIDTGADVTVVPSEWVARLGLNAASELLTESYDGRRATLTTYDIILRVAHLRIVGLSVVTFADDHILLGRDVLNHLRLLLDGPALSLEVLA